MERSAIDEIMSGSTHVQHFKWLKWLKRTIWNHVRPSSKSRLGWLNCFFALKRSVRGFMGSCLRLLCFGEPRGSRGGRIKKPDGLRVAASGDKENNELVCSVRYFSPLRLYGIFVYTTSTRLLDGLTKLWLPYYTFVTLVPASSSKPGSWFHFDS